MNSLPSISCALALLAAHACRNPEPSVVDTASVMHSYGEGRAFAGNEARVLIGLAGDTLAELRLGDEEWAARLDEEAYYILREDGTERAFTSDLLGVGEEGIFVCAGCGLPAYSSQTKFKSGTGWPSFYEPIRPDHVIELRDDSYGMTRTEVRCARCDGHHGHVFADGPEPTGLRYCINGDALSFSAGSPELPQAQP